MSHLLPVYIEWPQKLSYSTLSISLLNTEQFSQLKGLLPISVNSTFCQHVYFGLILEHVKSILVRTQFFHYKQK